MPFPREMEAGAGGLFEPAPGMVFGSETVREELPGMLAKRPGEIEQANGYRGPQLDDYARALRRRSISAGMLSWPP